MELIEMLSGVFVFGLIWGSFLNVVAHRLVSGKPFFTKRSMCPSCGQVIAWYDNIPVLSWILLGGKCRHCRKSISILYPFIEILTGLVFVLVFFKLIPHFSSFYYFLNVDPMMVDSLQRPGIVPSVVFYHGLGELIVYFIFFSALIAATRSDLESMVIPQIFSLWLVPIGALFSVLGLTDISFKTSLISALLGYLILWAIAFIFKAITKRDGMGAGDMELLAMIGSFLGPIGAWFSLLIGSFSGLFIGAAYLLFLRKERATRIPFGPFLVLGATIYFLFDKYLIRFFFS